MPEVKIESRKLTAPKSRITDVEQFDMEANFRIFGHVIKLNTVCKVGRDPSQKLPAFIRRK